MSFSSFSAQPVPAMTTAPAHLYDRVTQAWLLLLGEELHYGYFDCPDEPLAHATKRLTKRMAHWANIQSGAVVLDVGCGIGKPAITLATEFGADVVGISTSEVGINYAAALVSTLRLSKRVRFELRDGMGNGFPSESFDCVWVMESSHLMPRKRDVLAEGARVLVPGGRLVLCDIVRKADIPFDEIYRNLDVFETLDDVFGRAKMESLDAYVQFARDANLSVTGVEDISAAVLPTFDHWRDNAIRSRAEVVNLVGENYWMQFMKSCDALERLWNEGKFGYGMLVAEKPKRDVAQ